MLTKRPGQLRNAPNSVRADEPLSSYNIFVYWLVSYMTLKLCGKFFMALAAILSIGGLLGCAAWMSTPAAQSLATATPPACQPAQISNNTFPEIQGAMNSDGEMWALLFFDKGHAKEDLKIVWRITGSGEQFTVTARSADGTVVSPIWGPERHGSSTWERPGAEWGTGFNFPTPGCWTLTATRGATTGAIRLDILSP